MGGSDEQPRSGSEPGGLTRRELLVGGAALAAVTMASACGDDGDAGSGSDAGTDETTTTRPPPDLGTEPFTLGVASGDPLHDRVVIWTRLAPDPLADDGRGGMPDEPVDVRWVVRSAGGGDIVREGAATARPEHGHSVHVDVDGLDPAADYDFHFVVGDTESPVGRTRTLPTGSPDRFRVAVVNCQWLEMGTYGAYRHLVEDGPDLVLHLGDYIYEFPGAPEGERRSAPAHLVQTLSDYRLRYASYRLDADLQAAHATLPFVATWDDHEVANNYTGDVVPGTPPGAEGDRRAAAYQAWWEHMPVRAGPPDDGSLEVHQAFDVGDLARVFVLDQRQYADVPPCRDTTTAVGDFGDCDARTTEDRTLLGDAQEAWFADQAQDSTARWNLIGNPIVLAGIDGGNDVDGSKYYLETWDGYPSARHRFIDQLATLDNPVVLTGDYHAGMVLDVHERPFADDAGAVVAPELMAPPISSPLFADDVSGRTPHLRQQINAHGYLSVEVTPDEVRARFQVLDDVANPDTPISTADTWVVADGARRAVPA